MPPEISRPAAAGGSLNGGKNLSPSDVNADLKNLEMTEGLTKALGIPSVVSKPFVVRYGIFSGLNHTPTNKTGYDCSMRLAVYENVGRNSVNINGAYFEKFWAYLMKPKYVIQGMPGQTGFEDEKESWLDKIRGWVQGGSSKNGAGE
jgi:hypothetical protein